MIVAPLTSSEDGELTDFLGQLAETRPALALAYHAPFHRDLMRTHGIGTPSWLGARRDGRLVGVLPTVVRRSDTGTVLCSLPFFGPNAGPLCHAKDAAEAVPALVSAARGILAAQPDPLSMTLYGGLDLADDDLLAAAMPEAVVIERFSQVTDLDGTPWSKGMRYDIRRAHALGLTIDDAVTDNRVAEMYALYRQNCADAGIPLKPFALLADLAAQARPEGPVRLSFAFHDGRMVAALMVLWGPRTVSYYLPCTLAEARALQPGVALIDAAATQARAAGRTLWNWEGSPSRECGVYKFKARWNTREVPFRIRVEAWAPLDRFRALGRERIAAAFPGFFVYPFNLL